tara:strand:- start:17644 stop:17988 length:345 start_codon:yes stop_codon:yes gene_type:complete
MNILSFIYIKPGNEYLLQNDEDIRMLNLVTGQHTKTLYVKSSYKTHYECIDTRLGFREHARARDVEYEMTKYDLGSGIMLLSNNYHTNLSIVKEVITYLQDVNHPWLRGSIIAS